MFAIIFIYITLFLFVFMIAASLLYLVYVDWTNKRFNESVNKIYQEFGALIVEDLTLLLKKKPIDLERVSEVKKKLAKSNFERVFQNVIVKFSAVPKFRRYTSRYMVHFEDYLLYKMRKIKPNGSVVHVQNAFMLGEYRLNTPKIISYLLEGVHSQSIVSRFNSMSAISKIGDAEAMVQSLFVASEDRRYLNMKVLTDILDNFEGDKNQLNRLLVDSFMVADQELKRLLINYFYNENSELPASVFHQFLSQIKDKEEHIQLLKYFQRVQYPVVLEQLIGSLSNEYWEVRAIAAKALINYTEYFDLDNVIDSLKDSNWYVRTNMATTVLEYITNQKEQREQTADDLIESLNDKYAIGALEYAIHLEESTEFLEELLQKMQQKEL